MCTPIVLSICLLISESQDPQGVITGVAVNGSAGGVPLVDCQVVLRASSSFDTAAGSRWLEPRPDSSSSWVGSTRRRPLRASQPQTPRSGESARCRAATDRPARDISARPRSIDPDVRSLSTHRSRAAPSPGTARRFRPGPALR